MHSLEGLLEGLSIEPARSINSKTSSVVTKKKDPCERAGKEQVEVVTNVFPLFVVPMRVYRYDVSITMIRDRARPVDLIFKGNYSKEVSERRKLCLHLVEKSFHKYNIIKQNNAFIHDGSYAVFCTDDITYALRPFKNCLRLGRNEITDTVRTCIHIKNIDHFVVEVKSCDQSFITNDYEDTQCNPRMDNMDRTARLFYELLTAYDARKSGKFHCIGSHKMFEINQPREDLKCGHERAFGLVRTIKFIEGSEHSFAPGVVPSLILDAKTTDFYKNQYLRDSVIELLRHFEQNCFPFHTKVVQIHGESNTRLNQYWSEVNRFIKDLRMERPDDENYECSFIAVGITKIPISEFPYSDRNSPEYRMRAKFDRQWKRVDDTFPAVIFSAVDDNRNWIKLFYPMEALTVAGGQSVSIDKTVVDPDKAAKPDIRFSEIDKQLRMLNLHDSGVHNTTLLSFGVKVADKALHVMGVLREKPTIGYSHNGEISYIKPNVQQGNWKRPQNGNFVVPAIISQLFIIGERAICESVKLQLANNCRNMRVKQCYIFHFSHEEEDTHVELNKMFVDIGKEKIPDQFIIFIDNEEKKTHGDLKLLERQHNIRTMHLTSHIASLMKSRPATRDNIINKLNEKAGGVNHITRPDEFGRIFLEECILFVGYDISHPGPDVDVWGNIEVPSVVGFSFNGGKDKSAFIGDFHFQKTRQEKVAPDILQSRMQWMLRLFHDARECLPSVIFILRDGISEGQIAMVMKEEFSALLDGVDDYKKSKPYMKELQEWFPKFVLMVVTKRHNMRIVSESRGRIVNTSPGTVIDTTVIRNDICEFFLQSHKVIQGTGKFPSYSVLVDNLDLSSDTIQSLMYVLTYMHKIIDSPVSLPEPIYQADEYAKRGSNLFDAFTKRHKLSSFVLPENHRKGYGPVPLDFEKITRVLGYWNTPLEKFRINA